MVLAKAHTQRPMEQNRGPRNKPNIHRQTVFNKGAKNIQKRKEIFNKWSRENLESHIKE